MDHDRFDLLTISLTEGGTRRTVLRRVASGGLTVLMAALGAAPEAEARHRPKKRRRKRRRPQRRRKRCGRKRCNEHFTRRKDRNFCQVKCGRCRKRGKFCVIEGRRDDPAKLATCCHANEKCCRKSLECCPRNSTCCDDPTAPLPCCPAGRECCPDDPAGCCPEGVACCRVDPWNEGAGYQGGCCPDSETCCQGVGCVDTETDQDHCGRCGIRCPEPRICLDGRCCLTGHEPDHWCNTLINPNTGCCSQVCMENERCQPI